MKRNKNLCCAELAMPSGDGRPECKRGNSGATGGMGPALTLSRQAGTDLAKYAVLHGLYDLK